MAKFTNQAKITYNGGITIPSNTVTGNILEVLSAEKNFVENSYQKWDELTLVIHMKNYGPADFTGVTVLEDLGKRTLSGSNAVVHPLTYINDTLTYYINGELQTPPTATITAGDLKITGLNLPKNSIGTLIFKAYVNEFAPLDKSDFITSTAIITASKLYTVEASADIGTADDARLTIHKSVSPNTILENQALTYTFDIINVGNTDATADTNVILSDTFKPILTKITATYNKTLWPATNYTYSTTTGVFTSNTGAIQVPAATYEVDEATGEVTVTPGITTIAITGTIKG